MTGCVVVGNPDGRRVALFQEAMRGRSLRPARVVPWIDLLSGVASLEAVVRPGDVVRIESPGKDFEVGRRLLALGADVDDDPFHARADASTIARLPFDKGLILWPRQWFLGFRAALAVVREQLARCPPHRSMSDPSDIEVMFDKPRCHARLMAAGVAVPPALQVDPAHVPPGEIAPSGRPGFGLSEAPSTDIRSFDELSAAMSRTNCPRVFVKLAHGSSASGVVAYATDGRRHRASTTVETVRQGGVLRLYNSRRVRTLADVGAIAAVVDALCRHRVHVERWLPKAGLSGQTFDLRVVTIGGRARHAVVRLSRTPMTNLHLLNRRDAPAALRARMGEPAWADAMRTCEHAAGCFPRSLHAGVDLLIGTSFRRHAVLEVNAFGDLLPGVTCDGVDTYAAEIDAMGAWEAVGVG